MTRKGKIARLPRAVRDELNSRLLDGEPQIRLVEWLNGLPEVQAVLRDGWEGRLDSTSSPQAGSTGSPQADSTGSPQAGSTGSPPADSTGSPPAISEQNLSAWKDGGYKDWRRSQQAFELASAIMEDAQDRGELTKNSRLSDRVGEMAALSLARMIQATMEQDNGAEQQLAALKVIREIVRLRQSDRAYERALREQDLHVRRSR